MISQNVPIRLFLAQDDTCSDARHTVLGHLATIMADRLGAKDSAATILASAQERESLESTYIGHGMAIPHARVPGLGQAGVLLMRCPQGIRWPSEIATQLIFLTVPEERPDWYLHILSRIMHWRHDLKASETEILQMPEHELREGLARVLYQ